MTTLTPSLRAAVSADFRGATWRQRLLLVLVVAWIAYEWGIGNETVTPWILVQVITAFPGSAAIPATAAVGFVFTVIQQFVAGVTALAGFRMFDRSARAAWSRLRANSDRPPTGWAGLGWGGRSIVVFTLGTTAIALIEVMTSGRVGVRRHLRIITQSALLVGALVAVAGAVVATLATIGRENERLAGPTDWVLRVLGNPLFWLGILLAYALFVVVRNRRSRTRRAPPDEDDPTVA